MHLDVSALVPSWVLQNGSGIQAYVTFPSDLLSQLNIFKSDPFSNQIMAFCDSITPADKCPSFP